MMQEKPDYHIVRLSRQDAELIKALGELRDGLMAYHNSYTSSEQCRNFVSQRLGQETMLLIFALDGDTPIGYGLAFDVAEHPFMPEWQRSGYITQFFVQAEHRRHGVGELLLDSITDWFTSRGITNVLLNVSLDNEVAQRFWEKHGFAARQIRMKRTSVE